MGDPLPAFVETPAHKTAFTLMIVFFGLVIACHFGRIADFAFSVFKKPRPKGRATSFIVGNYDRLVAFHDGYRNCWLFRGLFRLSSHEYYFLLFVPFREHESVVNHCAVSRRGEKLSGIAVARNRNLLKCCPSYAFETWATASNFRSNPEE